METANDFEAKQVRIAADKNISIIKNTFSKPHKFSIVDSSAFKHLSINFYEKCKNDLLGLGFKHLADIEDVSLKRQPDPRTFMRIMADNKNSAIVAIYQIKPKLLWSIFLYVLGGLRRRKIYEFESEFSDNTFITTTILPESGMLPKCAKTPSFHYPENTDIHQLYKLHMQNCAEHIKQDNQRKPILYQTIEDVEKSQNRQIESKYNYFLSIGYLSLEWLEKHTIDKKFARKVYDEIQRIAEAERLNAKNS